MIASDCVGPLPEYFDQMDLPEDFGPEREELLEQWRRIRDLDPAVVIPGHNPPVRLDNRRLALPHRLGARSDYAFALRVLASPAGRGQWIWRCRTGGLRPADQAPIDAERRAS